MDAATGTATQAILGREPELARLAAALEDDVPMVVVGEAGVGKTTLVREALRAAGRHRLEGGGFGSLAWAPYLALERALGRSLGGADPEFVARALADAVGDGVLFVDDLHWVDPASRAVIAALVGRIGLVLGVRLGDPGAGPALAELPPSVERLELPPLELDVAARLAAHVDPRLDPARAREIARRAGGNPLLVAELASAGEDAATLQAAVRIRLAALDAAGLDAMTLLSVAGHPMTAADLGSGAGSLASAGLAVVDAAHRLRVRHELIAASVADALAPDERAAVHARLARLVDDEGQRARHLLAAGERDRAHRAALAAADAAATEGERAAHLELAALTAEPSAARALRVRAAHALLDADEPESARAVLAGLDGAAHADVAHAEARTFVALYEPEAARAAVERGLALLAAGGAQALESDPAIEVGLRVEAAIAAARALDGVEAVGLATLALDAARRYGVLETSALATLGEARVAADDLGGIADLEAALARAVAERQHALAIRVGNRLVFALLIAGRPADGRRLVEDLAERARTLHFRGWEQQMRFWTTGFAWHAGDFEAAAALGAREGVDWPPGADWYEIQAIADLGRLDEARIRADRRLAEAQHGEYDLGEALWLATDVATWAGRWVDALAHADRHARELPHSRHRPFVEVAAAWAAMELGREPAWPRLETAVPIVAGAPLELEALRALAADRAAEAADGFAAAAEAWAGRHARGELRCLWARGESLRRAGRATAARDDLLALEERLVAVGHLPLLARTRRSLRLLGVRRAAARATAAGSPLTEREREILAMTGRGLRDAEIAARLGISRWAVVRAAESAAAKLGATTRAEAVAALAGLA